MILISRDYLRKLRNRFNFFPDHREADFARCEILWLVVNQPLLGPCPLSPVCDHGAKEERRWSDRSGWTRSCREGQGACSAWPWTRPWEWQRPWPLSHARSGRCFDESLCGSRWSEDEGSHGDISNVEPCEACWHRLPDRWFAPARWGAIGMIQAET